MFISVTNRKVIYFSYVMNRKFKERYEVYVINSNYVEIHAAELIHV